MNGNETGRVINGRLYEINSDNIAKPVPRSMSEVHDWKSDLANMPPDYVIKNDVNYEIVNAGRYVSELQEKDANVVQARELQDPAKQHTFVQIDKNIAVMKREGENDALVPQMIEKGGYLDITDPCNIYGVTNEDFKKTYEAVQSKILLKQRSLPEIDIKENDTDFDFEIR